MSVSAFLFLAAASGSSGASVRAHATARILAGERIEFASFEQTDRLETVHRSQKSEHWIVTSEREGRERLRARLIEFE